MHSTKKAAGEPATSGCRSAAAGEKAACSTHDSATPRSGRTSDGCERQRPPTFGARFLLLSFVGGAYLVRRSRTLVSSSLLQPALRSQTLAPQGQLAAGAGSGAAPRFCFSFQNSPCPCPRLHPKLAGGSWEQQLVLREHRRSLHHHGRRCASLIAMRLFGHSGSSSPIGV